MKRVNNWLRSLSIAYWSILNREERWLKRYKGYARLVVIGRRLFWMIIYTLVVWFLITVSIKLNWVVIGIPVG